MKKPSYDQLKDLYKRKGFPFNDVGRYHANIFGFRAGGNKGVDEFNDLIGVAYRDDFDDKLSLGFIGTTDPGLYWLDGKAAGNAKGTFILQPGFYKGCWKLGQHHVGKPDAYTALVQAANGVFKGWRDNDKDGNLDFSGEIYTDVQGLNLHTTSFKQPVKKVGPYSAACQVVQDDLDYWQLIHVVKKASEVWGDLFDYALFEEADLG